MKYLPAFITFITLSILSGYAQTIHFPYNSKPAKVRNYPALDTTQVRFRFRMLSVADTTRPERKEEHILMLQIGKNISKFRDYHRHLYDSTWNEYARKGIAESEARNKLQGLFWGTAKFEIFKNYPTAGLITTLDYVPFTTYSYQEAIPEIEWSLSSDTLTVCEYLCRKATARLFGRNYTAWYTSEIPIDNGPWKLGGLPGMILKAEDDRQHYSFECIAIERPTWGEIIYISKKPFATQKKRLMQQQKKYHENPGSYIGGSGIMQTPLPKHAYKSRPYNPIELNE